MLPGVLDHMMLMDHMITWSFNAENISLHFQSTRLAQGDIWMEVSHVTDYMTSYMTDHMTSLIT